jgi:N6-L-threonylcarbamoyladenine synthase
MKVLGIESSCDDTGIALIDGNNICENIVLKQEHKKGVIPEYAARAHHSALFEYANDVIGNKKIDLIAYTAGPGLIGSLFVGSCFAKGLSYSSNIPSIGVNHLEAHVILPYWLNQDLIEFPYLCLLISGGHTMLILVRELGKYEILARTLDDAVGEVFDKVARYIGLDYPGGPEIEKVAKDNSWKDSKSGYEYEFKFPNVMQNRDDFSFSGLKTAAMMHKVTEASRPDFCAQFQEHIANLLSEKTQRAFNKVNQSLEKPIRHCVISGGVAANKVIRAKFDALAQSLGCAMHYPPIEYCTDNGLMIAALGQLRYEQWGSSGFDEKIFASAKWTD